MFRWYDYNCSYNSNDRTLIFNWLFLSLIFLSTLFYFFFPFLLLFLFDDYQLVSCVLIDLFITRLIFFLLFCSSIVELLPLNKFIELFYTTMYLNNKRELKKKKQKKAYKAPARQVSKFFFFFFYLNTHSTYLTYLHIDSRTDSIINNVFGLSNIQ